MARSRLPRLSDDYGGQPRARRRAANDLPNPFSLVNQTQPVVHIRGTRTQLTVLLTVGLAFAVGTLVLALVLLARP